MGIQTAAGRIGAIAGTILFGQLTEVDLSLPILVVSTSLTVGSLAVFLLPWSKQWLQRVRSVCPNLPCDSRPVPSVTSGGTHSDHVNTDRTASIV